MIELIQSLWTQVSQNEPAMLVSVVSSSGSAPRHAGAQMTVCNEGRLKGTISGGQLEQEAIERAKVYLRDRKSALEEHDLAGDGMICGGDVELLYTYIEPTSMTLDILEQMKLCIEAHSPGWMILPLEGGFGYMPAKGDCKGLSFNPDEHAIRNMDTGLQNIGGLSCYVISLTSLTHVYIFGGGHLACELVPLLFHLGFPCVVTDDRPDYSSRDRFPEAQNVHTYSFDSLSGKFDISDRDFIVVLTHGHEGDYEVEKFALDTSAAFIGIVGSKRKSAALRQRLLDEGYSAHSLDRVHSPIGIPIGSETPAEIAVSIAAQLIEQRARLRS